MAFSNSAKRVLNILNLFSIESPEYRVTQAAQSLGMNKSTVARMMSSLEENGVLKRNTENRKYRLGAKVCNWARVFNETLDLKFIAKPYLKRLSMNTGLSSAIMVVDGDKRLCLDATESTHMLRLQQIPGAHHPLHAGAAGKLLLTYMPEEKRNQILAQSGLPRFTARTITRMIVLQKELDCIRKQGYAVSSGEYLELAVSLFAPVRDYSGEVVAAIGIAGLISQFTPEEQGKYVGIVTGVAVELSKELGYQGPYYLTIIKHGV
jgi:DNA-binding IclR family transcriptional regulator